jgi:MoaA/NifB/PqqE/SkfB family radical SAM enzyme
VGCFNHEEYISVTMEFRCNLKCVHCMIEGTMDTLAPQTIETFDQILEINRQENRWKGIILTGSEITLHKDLVSLAQQARQSGFEKVRIQTHGMHLGQPSFAEKLLNAGVNEFFVSVAGSDAETHDNITGIKGSFSKMMDGMEYLDGFDHVGLITNTVVTQLSYRLLPAMVDALAHLKQLKQMEFWHYWPMQELDNKGLIARHEDILPFLETALGKLATNGCGVEVKNFPECMLGEYADTLDNNQPELLIDPEFWSEFNRNGFHQCVHGDVCTSQRCLGLNQAYTAKYGWEKDLLSPIKPRQIIVKSG